MGVFEQIIGKKRFDLSAEAVRERAGSFDSVTMDIGTGQGKFVTDEARNKNQNLVIGLDAAADNMGEASRKAAASLKKGGLPNALFVRGAAESLPGPFLDLANTVFVQYPWGSLMRIVSQPDTPNLLRIRKVGRPDARLTVLLNYSVFEDRDYLDRLGMGDITDPAENDHLPVAYEEAGFRVETREVFHGDPPVRSAWGRHLVRGSSRATLLIDAVAIDLPEARGQS